LPCMPSTRTSSDSNIAKSIEPVWPSFNRAAFSRSQPPTSLIVLGPKPIFSAMVRRVRSSASISGSSDDQKFRDFAAVR
jgi:hypothetical protein